MKEYGDCSNCGESALLTQQTDDSTLWLCDSCSDAWNSEYNENLPRQG